MLLGEVLREQAGEELFADVEALRQGTIRRRDAEAHGLDEEAARHAANALELVHALPVEQAILLTRAFAFYFELINLAETNHRKRRRIALRLSGQAGRQRGSLAGTLSAMRRVGIGADEALDWLKRVLIVPVVHCASDGGGAAVGDVQAAADWGFPGHAGSDSRA